jgi:hypothetical protein
MVSMMVSVSEPSSLMLLFGAAFGVVLGLNEKIYRNQALEADLLRNFFPMTGLWG